MISIEQFLSVFPLPAKVGSIITVQHLMHRFQISLPEAQAILEHFEGLGFLTYDEGGNGKSPGWHLTEKIIPYLA